MRIGVLGAIEVLRDEVPVDLGGRKQRTPLAALALTPGRAVPVPALVEHLWGDAVPPGAPGTLQTYVAGFRRARTAGTAVSAATITLTTPIAVAVPNDS